ncbi:MAG: hypothetical protein WC455_21790 [Dehalococcoidia bacterium]
MTGTEQELGEQLEQAGQPASTDASLQEQQPEPVSYVSRDEFVQALEMTKREMQGLVDKSASRTDKRLAESMAKVDDLIQLNKAAGIPYTPQQEEQLRRVARDQALTPPQEQQFHTETLQQPSGREPAGVDPVTATANAIITNSGVSLDKRDPEFKMIDINTEDPFEYLQSVKNAVAKKTERLAKPKGNPAATPGALVQGSPANLQAEYDKKKSAIHGDVDALFNLKDEYRKKGLKIE